MPASHRMSCVSALRALVCATVILVSGCAVAPSALDAPPAQAGAPFAPYFYLAGRISVRENQRGDAGQLRWTHSRDVEEIQLLSPLGQVVAQIEQRAGRDALLRTGSDTRRAGTMADLTRDALGTAVPVHDLGFWLQGRVDPASGDAEVGARDANGRPAQLTHAGWSVALDDFRLVGAAVVATRLTARRGDTVIKMVVDDWKALP